MKRLIVRFLLSITLVILASLFALATPLFAAPYSWIDSYPTTSNPTFLEQSRTAPNIVVSSINSNNNFDIIMSTNSGETWKSIKGNLPEGSDINWISLNDSDPNILAVSLWGSGVFLTSNNGLTWNNIFPSTTPRSVEIDPINENKIIIGIGGGNSNLSGVYISNDRGINWTKTTALGNRNNAQITIDYLNPNRIFADADPNFYRSMDGGQSWISLPILKPFTTGTIIDRNFPNTIYTGRFDSDEGVYKSTDNGDTWTWKNNGLSGKIFHLAQDMNGNIYASRVGSEGGLWKSDNNGDSWENISGPGWENANIFGITANSSRVFVGIEGKGIMFSDGPSNTPDPVVFIPGLFGSWSYKGLIEKEPTETIDWILTPVFTDNYYQPLLLTLEKGGLVKNTSLFVFAYDWRNSISTTSELLNSYLDSVVIPKNPGKKVNLIGHSMGGLISVYCYEKVTNCSSKINKIVTGGSPLKGALPAYKFWHGGVIEESNPVLRVIEEAALRLTGFPYLTRKDIIQNTMPSIKDILPISDYIENKPYSLLSSESKNSTLENIKLLTDNLKNSSLSLSGKDKPTEKIYRVVDPNIFEKSLGLWKDGKVIGSIKGDGDGTVLQNSSLFGASSEALFSLSHTDYFGDSNVINKVTNFLGINAEPNKQSDQTSSLLMFVIHSPAIIRAFNSNGSEIGQNFNGKSIFIANYLQGEIKIEVEGLGDGDYTLESYFADAKSNFYKNEVTGKITKGEKINKVFSSLDNSYDFVGETNLDYLAGFIRYMNMVPSPKAQELKESIANKARRIYETKTWKKYFHSLELEQHQLSSLLQTENNPLYRNYIIQATYYYVQMLSSLENKFSPEQNKIDSLISKISLDIASHFIKRRETQRNLTSQQSINIFTAREFFDESKKLLFTKNYYKSTRLSMISLDIL